MSSSPMEQHDAEEQTTVTPQSEPSNAASVEEKPEVQGDPGGRAITGWRWFGFNVTTLTSIFLYSLDNTIVANIQPAIVNHFNAVDELPWLSVGFMIGGLSLALPLGKLYALYDGKWIYITSTVIFMAASALCGGSPDMDAMIVGRVFAGAGGNGMYYGLLILMSVNTTDNERPAYLSLTGMCWGLGTVLGPVVGGAFELYTWRWAFYINLLFGAILIPASVFFIPSGGRASTSVKKRATTFDYVGSVLSIGAFITLIMGINFGGALYSWSSGSIIALFVVAGVLWISFAIQQIFSIFTSPDNRVFPVPLFKRKEPILLFIICWCVGLISYVAVYYIPLYFQFTRGDSAIKTSYRILPFIVFLIALILSSGYLMGRLGWYKPWYVAGSVIALIGAVLMSRETVHSNLGSNYGYQILIGTGAGAYTQAAFATIQAVVDPKEAGDGVTLMLVAQLCGLAFGLSVAGALFINLGTTYLKVVLPTFPIGQIHSLLSGTSGSVLSTFDPELRDQVLEAILSAWQKVFVYVYAAAALSLVLSAFLSNRRAFGVEPKKEKEGSV